MSFAAVISAHDNSSGGVPRAVLRFVGQSLVEYQARQAHDAGAELVLLHVDRISPEISQAIDRLTVDRIPVMLVRDVVELGRSIPPDADILLFADGGIVAQRHVAAMARAPAPAVLVTPEARAADTLERIDGQDRWAGIARLSATQFFSTVDMLGDWDLESTLLRKAVQANPARISIPSEAVLDGEVALVRDQRAADLLSELTVPAAFAADGSAEGAAEHYVFAPLARMLVQPALRHQVSANNLDWAGMAFAALGVMGIMYVWAWVALLLIATGLFLRYLAQRIDRVLRRPVIMGWRTLVTPGLAALGLALLGSLSASVTWTGRLGGIYLALLLLIADLALSRDRLGRVPSWAAMTLATGVLLLIPFTFLGGVSAGFVLLTAAGIATLGHALLGNGQTTAIDR